MRFSRKLMGSLLSASVVLSAFDGYAAKVKIPTALLSTSEIPPKNYLPTGDSILAPTEPFTYLTKPLHGIGSTNEFVRIQAATIGDKLYWATGTGTGAASYDLFDLSTSTWTSKGSLRFTRGYGGMAALNDLVYSVGGVTTSGGQFTNIVDVYNPVTETWYSAAPLPESSYAPAVAAAVGKLYAIGGRTLGNNASPAVRQYDPGSNSWTSKASLLVGLQAPQANTIGTKIYTVGFLGSKLQIYDTATNTWSYGADVPETDASGRTFAWNNKLYLFQWTGGIFEYDPAANRWSLLSELARLVYPVAASSGIIINSTGATYLYDPVQTRYYIYRKK